MTDDVVLRKTLDYNLTSFLIFAAIGIPLCLYVQSWFFIVGMTLGGVGMYIKRRNTELVLTEDAVRVTSGLMKNRERISLDNIEEITTDETSITFHGSGLQEIEFEQINNPREIKNEVERQISS